MSAIPVRESAGLRFQSEVEARLRLQLRQAEGEIEQLAGQLVETQDLLLAMYELSRATRSQIGMAETLRNLTREATRLVNVQGAVLAVGPTVIQYPSGMIDDQSLHRLIEISRHYPGQLALDASQGSLPAGLANLCLMPMQILGQTEAVLGLLNREGGFRAPELKLAQAIAEQAGAHIEHALLHQETLDQARLQAEMAVARRVQLQLLPQGRPHTASLDFYAESRPALHVGGDFYDFVEEPGRPLLLMLGDVAGKGISAAMIMGLIHTASRIAARFMPNPTPASVLRRTNIDLYEELTLLDAFTTAFTVQYEPEQQRICYANAGHAPVIFRPPEGPARMLEADGVPIGVLPMTLSEDYYLDFPPGALLVVTTDGFSEARDFAGQLFGYERLIDLVDALADRSAQAIGQSLYKAINDYSAGQPQDDDQTLLVIKGV